MAVDMDEGQRRTLSEWEDYAVGRVYKVEERLFRVIESFESTETVDGMKVTGRSFRYEWLDMGTKEVEMEQGTVTIPVASSPDERNIGVESVSDHKTKVKSGLYQEVSE